MNKEYQIKMFLYLYINKETIKHKTMKAFEVKTWLSENREVVIAKYNKLTAERFFNGISLKDFMVAIMIEMSNSNPKDEKKATISLTSIMASVYVRNSSLQVVNDLDKKAANKYKGTAYMAMV